MKGQRTVFLITDAQIKEEAFLEDVDSVLNTGEVPNLFAVDEKQEIMEVNASYFINVMLLIRSHILSVSNKLFYSHSYTEQMSTDK